MAKRILPLAGALVLVATIAGPVSAGRGWVDKIEDIETVIIVRDEPDFPLNSIMRADCDFTLWIQHRTGRGTEVLSCRLSDEPVMVAEFQGTPPEGFFFNRTGPCAWTSDYWWYRDESSVMAESAQYVITPSGRVFITASYPAQPLVCEA
jgi:hypothetical protein